MLIKRLKMIGNVDVKMCHKIVGSRARVVAHTFNLSPQEAEEGLSVRPASCTKWIPGLPAIYRKTMSQKIINKHLKNIYMHTGSKPNLAECGSACL